jgi:hypothetical protein
MTVCRIALGWRSRVIFRARELPVLVVTISVMTAPVLDKFILPDD